MMATPFFYMFSLTFFTWEWYNKTEHIMQEKTMTLKKLPTGVAGHSAAGMPRADECP